MQSDVTLAGETMASKLGSQKSYFSDKKIGQLVIYSSLKRALFEKFSFYCRIIVNVAFTFLNQK